MWTEGSIGLVERRSTTVAHQSAPESDWRSEILEAQKLLEAAVSRYSTLATVYELWARVTESGPRRRVLELAEIRDGEAILEVATGTGAQLVSLAQRNQSGRTVGIELSDGMLAQARKRLQAAGLTSVELVRGTRYGCLLMTTASIFSSTATCSICLCARTSPERSRSSNGSCAPRDG